MNKALGVSKISSVVFVLLGAAGIVPSSYGNTKPKAKDIVMPSPSFWCPYTCDPKKDGVDGFQIDIAREVFRSMGREVKYEPTNYERSIQTVKSGSADALPSALPGEAEGFVYTTEPQMEQLWCFFAPAGEKWRFSKFDDLKTIPGKIGLVKGYSYGKTYDEFFEKNKSKTDVHFGDDILKRMVDKIEAKRGMIAFLEDKTLINYLLAQKKIKPLENLGCMEDVKSETYVAFSPAKPESKAMAEEYSAALKKLRASGKIDKIFQKYGLKDPFPSKK
jgi:polar amino acid transport system substrate-binding protein